jgi:guanylate kinase
MTGHLYIVTAPSGAGKTTLVRLLLENDPGIRLSISHTTRAPRAGERNGIEYHFTDVDRTFSTRFVRASSSNGQRCTATTMAHREAASKRPCTQARTFLLEIDWQGAQQVRRWFPAAIGVFVLPPSLDELARRLRQRATDSAETIARRVAAAREEMRHVGEFDYVIINDDLQRALHDLLAVVRASRLRYAAQRQRHPILF